MTIWLALLLAVHSLWAAERSLLSLITTKRIGFDMDFSKLDNPQYETVDWNYRYKAADNERILNRKFWSMPTFCRADQMSIRINEGDTLARILLVTIFYSGTSLDLELVLSRGLVLDEENCGKILFLLCTEGDEERKASMLSLVLSKKGNHRFVHVKNPLGLTNTLILVIIPNFKLTGRYSTLIRAGANILVEESLPFHNLFRTIIEYYWNNRVLVSELLKIAILYGRKYNQRELMEEIAVQFGSHMNSTRSYIEKLITKLSMMRSSLDKSVCAWWALPGIQVLGEDCAKLVQLSLVLEFQHHLTVLDRQARRVPYG